MRKSPPQDEAPRLIPLEEHGIPVKNICKPALKTIERLKHAGFDAYIVGGAIRDLVLGETPKDFDVATNATPEQVEKLFDRCRRIGRRFQLVHVYFHREVIEVSTFRASIDYSTSHPDRTSSNGILTRDNVYGSAQEDAIRRDFTINALFYDVDSQTIIDYANGYIDLQNKILRTIGPAEVRFREDPVRILRAVRFQAKLNATLCPEAESMVREHSIGLQEIPAARLLDECIKLFHSGDACACWALLRKYDLLRILFAATETALRQDTGIEAFILAGLENTDTRIRQNKPLNPAFFLAIFLWGPLYARLKNKHSKKDRFQVLHTTAWQIIQEQSVRVAIPRRIAGTIMEIWSLQDRFVSQSSKRCQSLLQHPKFRAAYDFMCLRSLVGELDSDVCRWWTEIQNLSREQQAQEFQKRFPQSRRKKRR